jgi:RNA polymerase sigma-70 factor (ECF subfamily)
METSASLLEQLRSPTAAPAWQRFVDLYTPLLYSWASRQGLGDADAADLVQEVLMVLVQKLPEFTYDRSKSFRGWLRTILINKAHNYQRRPPGQPLKDGGANLPDPNAMDELAEAEYRQYLVQRALQIMQADFQPATWKAFWEYVVCNRPAEEVARELGLSANAVYLAKSRVLGRLRQELDGLLD